MKKIIPALSIFLLLFFCSTPTHAQKEYWGVTTEGGQSFLPDLTNVGNGVIFKTDKNGQNQQVVYNFGPEVGYKWQYSLTEADNGKLYGILPQINTGLPENGGIYEIDPATGQYVMKKILTIPANATTYAGPGGKLLKANDGKLYGTKQYLINDISYKILYSYNPTTNILSDVHRFLNDGGSRIECLTQGSNGKLYILFESAGDYGHNGALIEYDLATNTEIMVHDFIDINGSIPVRKIIEWSPNIFYGCFTNGNDEALAKGGIYRFDATTRAYSIVARMDSIGGDGPFCSLSRVGSKLYGTTILGSGDPDPGYYYQSGGIIFSFEPATNTLKKLYELDPLVNSPYYIDSLLGGLPYLYGNRFGRGVELLATNGFLYGLTERSMFKFNTLTNEFTNLFGLTSYKGRKPIGGLIEVCTKPNYNSFTIDTITATIGQPFSFTISSKNTDTFHWKKNNIFINDRDSILNFNPFTITDTGRYTCQLTNECGNTVTKTILVRILNTNPVTLLYFTALLQNNNSTLLNWQTSQELNNSYFNIQQSTNGINFTNIGRVNGNGTTSIQQNYQYVDSRTPNGIVYYRLQQIDFDGEFRYSNIVPVNNSKKTYTVVANNQAYSITINFVQAQPSNAQVNLFAANGQLVKSITHKGNQQIIINTQQLADGVYQLQVITHLSNITQKIFIKN